MLGAFFDESGISLAGTVASSDLRFSCAFDSYDLAFFGFIFWDRSVNASKNYTLSFSLLSL